MYGTPCGDHLSNKSHLPSELLEVLMVMVMVMVMVIVMVMVMVIIIVTTTILTSTCSVFHPLYVACKSS